MTVYRSRRKEQLSQVRWIQQPRTSRKSWWPSADQAVSAKHQISIDSNTRNNNILLGLSDSSSVLIAKLLLIIWHESFISRRWTTNSSNSEMSMAPPSSISTCEARICALSPLASTENCSICYAHSTKIYSSFLSLPSHNHPALPEIVWWKDSTLITSFWYVWFPSDLWLFSSVILIYLYFCASCCTSKDCTLAAEPRAVCFKTQPQKEQKPELAWKGYPDALFFIFSFFIFPWQ